MKIRFIIVFCSVHFCMLSQNVDTSVVQDLNSTIIDHSNIQRLIDGHILIQKKKPFVQGFRIQIYNGNNKMDANQVKTEFYRNYPGLRCYLTYQQPYYRVRVGDFQDQNSAKQDLKKLAKSYPSSFLVPDQIKRIDKEEDNQ